MISNKVLQKQFNEVLEVILNIKNKDTLFLFLRDLLSENEIIEFSKRFEIARMLEDWFSYQEIESTTKMSSTTIARVSKYLKWNNSWYLNAIKIIKAIYGKHHEVHRP